MLKAKRRVLGIKRVCCKKPPTPMVGMASVGSSSSATVHMRDSRAERMRCRRRRRRYTRCERHENQKGEKSFDVIVMNELTVFFFCLFVFSFLPFANWKRNKPPKSRKSRWMAILNSGTIHLFFLDAVYYSVLVIINTEWNGTNAQNGNGRVDRGSRSL